MTSTDDTHTSSNAISNSTPTNDNEIELTILHHGNPTTLRFPTTATLDDLSSTIASDLSIPPSNQKLLITPKLGLQKPPFKDPAIPLTDLLSKKITLMGSTPSELNSLSATISAATAPRRPSPIKPATPSRSAGRTSQRIQEDATYTFHTLRPLTYLPRPERSLAFLERLRDDAGIRAAMRAHRFSVPLLTEMDPAMHTTHESRTLGLNRNRGEVIELRLRTDAYDGYRDYKTIRKTLCHELAHNVFGPHDRDFWNLCHQIEKEVERDDWRSGGRSVGDEVYYEPEEEEFMDHGGWTGGGFVLGGGSGEEQTVISSAGGEVPAGGLNRRDVLARAAEERMKRAKQVEEKAKEQGNSGSERSVQ